MCCWYVKRSRLTKAVMARILGLAGSGAGGVVVPRWALALVAPSAKASRSWRTIRIGCRDIFGLAPAMGKDTSGGRGGGRKKGGTAVGLGGSGWENRTHGRRTERSKTKTESC